MVSGASGVCILGFGVPYFNTFLVLVTSREPIMKNKSILFSLVTSKPRNSLQVCVFMAWGCSTACVFVYD